MKPNIDLFHRPTRGSEVEAWMKRMRDLHPAGSPAHRAVDQLLDDYRLRADYGIDLDGDVEDVS